MFFANHALTSASGSIVSGSRRRGPGFLVVTMAAIGGGAVRSGAFVRSFGLRGGRSCQALTERIRGVLDVR
jgi:hypothetical protein